jgi:hypothetical protein
MSFHGEKTPKLNFGKMSDAQINMQDVRCTVNSNAA